MLNNIIIKTDTSKVLLSLENWFKEFETND